MDDLTQLKAEAAAFRRLKVHLDERRDVQNIDMMNLTGFCRNCLSRWYQEAANELGVEMSKDQGREAFYGMPYADWRAQNQTAADAAKLAAYEIAKPKED
ncbi:MAG: DUF1244 domain-containing protein [Rhodobacteraceae bacterium]|nr:DUF1244 domain-containing protein [Paracoccaceae bacterium]